MWRTLIVFVSVLAVCYCQSSYNLAIHKKKPYKHHYHHDPFYLLYGGGFVYLLTFILIKVKIVFVLGTIFTLFLFGGKLWALIKFAESGKLDKQKHQEPEKIYIQAPIHGGHDYGPISYSAPMDSFQSSYSPSFSSGSGVTYDKLPPNAELAGGGSGAPGGYFDGSNHRYGRSYESGTWYDSYKTFFGMLGTLNLTDIAFNTMKLTTDECRRRFVCKVDFSAKQSLILSTGLNLLNDDSYQKFRTNKTITSIEECEEMYPNCAENIT